MSTVQHTPRPDLLAPLTAPFALRPAARAAAVTLLWAVRVPGAMRLLLAWHARRTRSAMAGR